MTPLNETPIGSNTAGPNGNVLSVPERAVVATHHPRRPPPPVTDYFDGAQPYTGYSTPMSMASSSDLLTPSMSFNPYEDIIRSRNQLIGTMYSAWSNSSTLASPIVHPPHHSPWLLHEKDLKKCDTSSTESDIYFSWEGKYHFGSRSLSAELLGLGFQDDKGASLPYVPGTFPAFNESLARAQEIDARHSREAAAELVSWKRSKQVRTHIGALLVVFIIGTLANTVLTIVSLFESIPEWSTSHGIDAIYMVFVILPRLLMLLALFFSIITFEASLLWWKEEPQLYLKDFMSPKQYPTVDVFLPRYKEEWELYGPVVEAVLTMDYPADRFLVHVCDDGSRSPASLRDKIQSMMLDHPNLRYITRENGIGAKGGNLNNALKQSSNQLVMVIDADHVVKPDFLLRTIPHLLGTERGHRVPRLSNRVAFVQTTQVFYNAKKPMCRLLDGSQALFYKLMMPSYGGMGLALCVGTGYVMQRAALKDIGHGYVTDCAVEDVVTALAMHDRGWTSKYLDCCLATGLSPETLSEFFCQRERWVAGSAQLLLYKNPLFKARLSFHARIAYLVGTWYWLVVSIFLALIMGRLIVWVIYRGIMGTPITVAMPLAIEYIPFFLTFMLMPCVSVGDKIANLISLLAFMPTYLSVLWGAITGRLNPKKNTFRVSASSEAFGDPWPRLAWINVGFVSLTTLLFIIVSIPKLSINTTVGDWMVPALILLWVYMSNAPVIYDVGKRALDYAKFRFRVRTRPPNTTALDSPTV